MCKKDYNDYLDNLEHTETIKCDIDIQVKIYSYTEAREYNNNGKWQHSEPSKIWYKLKDISYFREQRETDKYTDCNWISDSTVMPTKWCMMVYFDDFTKKQKVIPVVGDADDLNKRIEYLKDTYYKGQRRLDSLKDDIKNLYINKLD